MSVSVTLVVVIVISPVQSQDMPVDDNYLIRFFTNVNYRLSYEMSQYKLHKFQKCLLVVWTPSITESRALSGRDFWSTGQVFPSVKKHGHRSGLGSSHVTFRFSLLDLGVCSPPLS